VRAAGIDVTQRTFVGRRMTDATLKRLFVGPLGAEITGLTETPDGKALFINVQHPGENTGRAGAVPSSVAITPATPNGPFESNWPGNMGYGPGGATARPRSATVVITRVDGGVIGWDPTKPMT
jgi:secreted PhoX family phosphatase